MFNLAFSSTKQSLLHCPTDLKKQTMNLTMFRSSSSSLGIALVDAVNSTLAMLVVVLLSSSSLSPSNYAPSCAAAQEIFDDVMTVIEQKQQDELDIAVTPPSVSPTVQDLDVTPFPTAAGTEEEEEGNGEPGFSLTAAPTESSGSTIPSDFPSLAPSWVPSDGPSMVPSERITFDDSRCELNPTCAGLDLTGECCPSLDGVNLDCCFGITPTPTSEPLRQLLHAESSSTTTTTTTLPSPSSEKADTIVNEAKNSSSSSNNNTGGKKKRQMLRRN